MIIVAYIPFLFALLGLVLYFMNLPTHPKVTEVGRILFFCGTLVSMMSLASKVLKLG